MTGTPAEPQRGTRTPARPRLPLRPSSRAADGPRSQGAAAARRAGGPSRLAVESPPSSPGGSRSAGGRVPLAPPPLPPAAGHVRVLPPRLGEIQQLPRRLCPWSLRARRAAAHARSPHAPCRARLHLAPFGGGASGASVGVARPLGGPSEWETGEYLAGTGQMESTGSRGQPGLSWPPTGSLPGAATGAPGR